MHSRNTFGLLPALIASAIATTFATPSHAQAESKPDAGAESPAALKAQIDQLRTLVPSQSHAMMDVAYHFTNLWFAGQKRNWPLAQFYFNESRSHMQWAIRLVPVRHTQAGDLNLAEVFAALDASSLTELKNAIAAKDLRKFGDAYQAALGGCNGCHAAAEKPFLRVRVPDAPEVHIVDMSPDTARTK